MKKNINFMLAPVFGALGWYLGTRRAGRVSNTSVDSRKKISGSDKTERIYERILPVIDQNVVLIDEDYETWYALLVIMYHLYDVQNGLSQLDNSIVELSPLIRADYQACARFVENAEEGTHLAQLKLSSKEQIAQLLSNRK